MSNDFLRRIKSRKSLVASAAFVWAGLELASFNYVFDMTSPQRRAVGVPYYNVMNGICIFAGSVGGGLMVRYNDIFLSKYLPVFIVSCILSYTASFIFIPRLKEVRAVARIPYSRMFFKIVSTMPTFEFVYGLIPFKDRHNKIR